jgi:hypothetical protein
LGGILDDAVDKPVRLSLGVEEGLDLGSKRRVVLARTAEKAVPLRLRELRRSVKQCLNELPVFWVHDVQQPDIRLLGGTGFEFFRFLRSSES